jgi:osmotically inducible lipoprotein OsmB
MEDVMKKIIKLSGMLVLIMILGGCAGMSDTEQRAVTGSLIGAGAGGIIGAIAGNAGMGAAIGAGTGLVGGYLYGKHKESEQAAYERGVNDGRQGR